MYFNQSYLIRWLHAEKKAFRIGSITSESEWFQDRNFLLRIEGFDPMDKRIKHLTVFEIKNGQALVAFHDYEQVQRTEGGWVATKAELRSFMGGAVTTTDKTQSKVTSVDIDQVLKNPPFPSATLPLSAVYASWQSAMPGSYTSHLAELIFYKKILYLVSFFLFLLLSAVLSDSQPRFQNTSIRIIGSTLIYYLYWCLDQFMFLLSQENIIPTLVGVLFFPTVLFGSLWIILYFKNA